jgi:vancomycin resistance protein YoaR
MEIKYEIDRAVNLAYDIGRSGGVFKRFNDILKARNSDINIDLPISYNKDKINSIIQSMYNKTLINVKEADLFIQEDKITIRSGHHGENIDKDLAYKKIEESILSDKNTVVEIPIIITAPSRINVNDYYNQINREVKDAAFKVTDNKLQIVPEVIGRKIDKSDLEKIATELESTENTEKILPVTFVKPGILTQDVHAKLFKDVITVMKTHFNTNTPNNRNRSENLRLAASKINGKLLAPGEVFSFNATVGARTVEAGYKDAYVYKSGKVVPDLAGGICQVSSTLYNAVLQADLQVVERRNHMFIVTYVKPGTDATIFGNTTDFKFKNSTKWPLKIQSSITKDNNLVFTFTGTNENPGKTVEVSSVIRNEKDFTIKYVDDPNLPEGQTKVMQEGHKGMAVDTFKIIKFNGKATQTVKISTSTYQPLAQEIAKGTKKVQPSPPPAVKNPTTGTTKPTPNPTPKPVTNDTGNGADITIPDPGDVVDPGQ